MVFSNLIIWKIVMKINWSCTILNRTYFLNFYIFHPNRILQCSDIKNKIESFTFISESESLNFLTDLLITVTDLV